MSSVLFRLETSEVYLLDGRSFVIGSSAAESDLCLADASLERVHCQLRTVADGLVVEALSTADLFVNGRAKQRVELRVGDEFTVGKASFRILTGTVVVASNGDVAVVVPPKGDVAEQSSLPEFAASDFQSNDGPGNPDDDEPEIEFAVADESLINDELVDEPVSQLVDVRTAITKEQTERIGRHLRTTSVVPGAVPALHDDRERGEEVADDDSRVDNRQNEYDEYDEYNDDGECGDTNPPTPEAAASGNPLWRIRIGSAEIGPLFWSSLEDMLQQGQLKPDCLARPDSGGPWQQLGALLSRDHESRSGEFDGSEYLSDFPLSTRGIEPAGSPEARAVSAVERESGVVSSPAARSSIHRATAATGQIEEMTIAAHEPRPTHMQAPRDDRPDKHTRDEEQYFIKWGNDEAGPLPREAVQELADSGSITPETKTRREVDENWSTAASLRFIFPAPQTGTESSLAPRRTSDGVDQAAKAASRNRLSGSIMWAIFSPVYYARSAVSSLASLSRQQLAAVVVLTLAIGLLANRWNNTRAHTALTGIVTINGQPAGNAIVTFSGMATGQTASGYAGADGSFRLMTADGSLDPGPYRVSVAPYDAAEPTTGASSTPAIPQRYHLSTTSSLTIQVTAEERHYPVPLTDSGPGAAR